MSNSGVLDTRFRSALGRMAEAGRLTAYTAPADPHLEVAAIMKKLDGGPALLFTAVDGHAIAMPPPLTDKRVDYTDGAPMTVEQYAKDISAFLMWTAEPHLDARKRIGMQVFIFLIVLAGLLYFTKKNVWHAVELHPEKLKPREPTEYPRG